MENLQSKTLYKFKKTYGGTPEPQTLQDAPWLGGPSLKIYYDRLTFRMPGTTCQIQSCTVLLVATKSRTLEPLVFDEYCSFDTSAFF